MRKTVEVDFIPGDKVWIDRCSAITGVVCEISMFHGRTIYAVSWVSNGVAHNHYFDGFRLRLAE